MFEAKPTAGEGILISAYSAGRCESLASTRRRSSMTPRTPGSCNTRQYAGSPNATMRPGVRIGPAGGRAARARGQRASVEVCGCFCWCARLWTRDENGAVQQAAGVLRLHIDSSIGGERVLVALVAGVRLQLVSSPGSCVGASAVLRFNTAKFWEAVCMRKGGVSRTARRQPASRSSQSVSQSLPLT